MWVRVGGWVGERAGRGVRGGYRAGAGGAAPATAGSRTLLAPHEIAHTLAHSPTACTPHLHDGRLQHLLHHVRLAARARAARAAKAQPAHGLRQRVDRGAAAARAAGRSRTRGAGTAGRAGSPARVCWAKQEASVLDGSAA